MSCWWNNSFTQSNSRVNKYLLPQQTTLDHGCFCIPFLYLKLAPSYFLWSQHNCYCSFYLFCLSFSFSWEKGLLEIKRLEFYVCMDSYLKTPAKRCWVWCTHGEGWISFSSEDGGSQAVSPRSLHILHCFILFHYKKKFKNVKKQFIKLMYPYVCVNKYFMPTTD